VREEEDPVPSQEPRAVHDIGSPLDDELRQLRQLLGRVLEIRVLNCHDVAGHRGESTAQRRPLALVAGLSQQGESQLRLKRVEPRAGAIGRAVVHDDELHAHGERHHAPDDLVDRVAFVEHGHHDREDGRLDDRSSAVGARAYRSVVHAARTTGL
jgi:hypothetical protein